MKKGQRAPLAPLSFYSRFGSQLSLRRRHRPRRRSSKRSSFWKTHLDAVRCRCLQRQSRAEVSRWQLAPLNLRQFAFKPLPLPIWGVLRLPQVTPNAVSSLGRCLPACLLLVQRDMLLRSNLHGHPSISTILDPGRVNSCLEMTTTLVGG